MPYKISRANKRPKDFWPETGEENHMRSRVVTMFSIVLIVAFAISMSVVAAAQAPAGGPPAAGAQAPGGGAGRGGGAPGGAPGGGQGRGGGGGRGGPGMTLTSTAWPDGGEIPAKHAGGMAVSPALSWTNAPMGTAEFILIMNDPEPVTPALSVRGDILHWMLAKIPAGTTSLAEGAGAANSPLLPAGAVNTTPFRGPGAPAAGPRHHYTLTLYALNAPLDATALTSRDTVMAAMEGKVLARAIFGGRFMQAPPQQ
jgi:Raf kinase inhibitor-like YbhB/YbcL family protein